MILEQSFGSAVEAREHHLPYGQQPISTMTFIDDVDRQGERDGDLRPQCYDAKKPFEDIGCRSLQKTRLLSWPGLHPRRVPAPTTCRAVHGVEGEDVRYETEGAVGYVVALGYEFGRFRSIERIEFIGYRGSLENFAESDLYQRCISSVSKMR